MKQRSVYFSVLVLIAAATLAQAQYNTTILPLPAGIPDDLNTSVSLAVNFGLNNSGQVAGTVSRPGSAVPVLWTNGIPAVLPVPSGFQLIAVRGVNDAGVVVGQLGPNPPTPGAPNASQVVVWSGGTASLLPHYPTACAQNTNAATYISNVFGMNRAGHIAGLTYKGDFCAWGWIWDGTSFITQFTYRLQLDSGTQYVALDRKTAGKSHCTGGVDLDLVLPGRRTDAAKTLRADRLEIGDLTFRDVPTLVLANRLAEGIDGVIPLSLFDGFLIRLDIPALTLDLRPYREAEPNAAGAVPVFSSNSLLFLKGAFNETSEGYFLIDTGASYNAISQTLNSQSHRSNMFVSSVALRGGTAPVDAALFPDSATLRIGSLLLPAKPVVAIDLSTLSRYHNLEVSGLIGYPALQDSVLLLNYRDRWLQIKK